MAQDDIAKREDERLPERAARGNDANPERVPTKGHEGATRVPDPVWQKHGQRKDTADGLVGDQGPME